MKKEDNIAEIRNVAIAFLYLDIKVNNRFPIVAEHPFTDSIVTFDPKEKCIINLLEDEEGLSKWRNSLKELIQQEDAKNIFHIMNRKFWFTFFGYTEKEMAQETFAYILKMIWTEAEYVNDGVIKKKALISYFRKAKSELIMDQEELGELQGLPDVLTVYRGVTPYNEARVRDALSWTLSTKTAWWFANRFNQNGCVYQAEIEKKHVFALFKERGEQEIVLNPDFLMNLERRKK